ncbi:MAG TPA: ribosomal protein S18-alanine N-acetyltransferase [Thermoanaerobaculia bacterium]|nr:ribosomal protein S18-alanine N-acetyltransferase [Thermoanaerobaculia bacterium]
MRTRLATRSDVSAIAELEARSFPAPWRKEFFESEVLAPGRFNRIALDDQGKLVAYLFAMYFLDEMHINKIAVRAEGRRSGLATQMMKECIEFAIEHEVSVVSLEVRESNLGAQAFYRRIGFASSYVRPRYYPDGESAIVMTRRVGEKGQL